MGEAIFLWAILQVLVGWLVLPDQSEGWGHGAPAMYWRAREQWWPFPHHSKNGYPVTAQAATIDGFPSVASFYSLGRRLHYSVSVKNGGKSCWPSLTIESIRTIEQRWKFDYEPIRSTSCPMLWRFSFHIMNKQNHKLRSRISW